MEIRIDWQKPIQLTHHRRIIVDENDLPEIIEARSAVYFFSRQWGGVSSLLHRGNPKRAGTNQGASPYKEDRGCPPRH
jgi:hypothetical protein